MGPLEGLRVLDCSAGLAGRRTAGFLADYGADVIWVEPPGGDPLRYRMPAATSVVNRGKRSVVLDVGHPAGRRQVADLAGSVDVLIEDWAGRPAEKTGVDWPAIQAVNPRLVRCTITDFGTNGPDLPVKAYEAIVHALFGTMYTQAGHRDGPIFSGLPFAGIGTAYLALIGTLAALYRRNADGVGRHVETSMLDGVLAYLSTRWWDSDAIPAPVRKKGPATAGTRLITRAFICSDEKYIGIHTGAVGAFGRLMKLVGLDERIPAAEGGGRDMGKMLPPDQADIIANEFPAIIATKPREYWVERLREADVAGVEILDPGEYFDSPQAIHNDMILELEDPVLGRVQQVAPPAKFSRSPAEVRGPAPLPGQDQDSVLSQAARLLDSRAGKPEAREPDTRPLLDGVNILDCGAYYAGPYASRLLADLGANVVKLEPPQGDEIRGLNNCFYSAQAGKRSLAANLKDPRLHRAIDRLLRWADVVHHNMRPGAAERLGLGLEDYRKRRPEGIYLHAPGWGASGPFMRRQSFEPLQSGYCGVQFEVAGQFNRPLPPIGTGDPGGGLLGAAAILMALLERQRTGEGESVVNAQLNATMAHMAHVVRKADGEVVGAGQLDPLQMGVSALERLYQTADGWICLAAFEDDEIRALSQVLHLEILEDARFSTLESRRSHDFELATLIAELVEGRKTSDLIADLTSAGVAAAEPVPYETVPGLYFDPEFRRTGRVAECRHPVKGNVREVDQLLRCSDAAVVPHRLAPDIGQHSEAILTELCGYSPAEVADLHDEGVVVCAGKL